MLLSNLEYVVLRLARRFLFSDAFLAKFARFVPHYQPNVGTFSPESIVDEYLRWLAGSGRSIDGCVVAELGVGATNGSLYELAARGARAVYGVEPFVPFDAELDARLLRHVCLRAGVSGAELAARVTRIRAPERLPAAAVDVVVSSSVLEHVRDLEALFRACAKSVRPDGAMLHLIDFRDHFFKYPFHFLQFSDRIWNRYLDPGDLPRWRLSDPLRALQAAGWRVDILERVEDPGGLAQLRGRIDGRFDSTDSSLAVTKAVLLCRPEWA